MERVEPSSRAQHLIPIVKRTVDTMHNSVSSDSAWKPAPPPGAHARGIGRLPDVTLSENRPRHGGSVAGGDSSCSPNFLSRASELFTDACGFGSGGQAAPFRSRRTPVSTQYRVRYRAHAQQRHDGDDRL